MVSVATRDRICRPPLRYEACWGISYGKRTHHGPISEDEGDPNVQQRALPAHGMPNQEEGNPPIQEDEEEGTPPKQRALSEHGMQG